MNETSSRVRSNCVSDNRIKIENTAISCTSIEVDKAVIPAAGFGTRFLPVTKTQPKEMMPVLDKPTIQYVVKEAVQAGIHDILIIRRRGKQAIERHFDKSYELEEELESAEKYDRRDRVREIAELAGIHHVRQKVRDGLGDAVRYAGNHVGDNAFALLLGDTVIQSSLLFNRYPAPLGVNRC